MKRVIETGNVFLNKEFNGGLRLGERIVIGSSDSRRDGVNRKFALNLLRQVFKYNWVDPMLDIDKALVVRVMCSDVSSDTTSTTLSELMVYGGDIKHVDDMHERLECINNDGRVDYKLSSFANDETMKTIYNKIVSLHKEEGMNVLFLSDLNAYSLNGVAQKSNIADMSLYIEVQRLAKEMQRGIVDIFTYCFENDILLVLSKTFGSASIMDYICDRMISITEVDKVVDGDNVSNGYVDIEILKTTPSTHACTDRDIIGLQEHYITDSVR